MRRGISLRDHATVLRARTVIREAFGGRCAPPRAGGHERAGRARDHFSASTICLCCVGARRVQALSRPAAPRRGGAEATVRTWAGGGCWFELSVCERRATICDRYTRGCWLLILYIFISYTNHDGRPAPAVSEASAATPGRKWPPTTRPEVTDATHVLRRGNSRQARCKQRISVGCHVSSLSCRLATSSGRRARSAHWPRS